MQTLGPRPGPPESESALKRCPGDSQVRLGLRCAVAARRFLGPQINLKREMWGAWVAQSVKRPTSAQVMISRSVGSSPASGSMLTAQSLEPVSDSVSPSFSDSPLFMLSLCLKNK